MHLIVNLCANDGVITRVRIRLVLCSFLGRDLCFSCLPVAVVLGQVAVLTEAFGVVEAVVVRAGPGLLGAATTVVAVNAHILGVVLGFFVRALLADADGLHHLEFDLAALVALRELFFHIILAAAVLLAWHEELLDLAAVSLGRASAFGVVFQFILVNHDAIRLLVRRFAALGSVGVAAAHLLAFFLTGFWVNFDFREDYLSLSYWLILVLAQGEELAERFELLGV